MAFTDLLDALGGMGRFQLIYTTLLLLPCSLLACHNFLQNFTAAVPRHHCRGPAKPTAAATNSSGAWLRATVPLDQFGVPEPCQRFTEPQWALLSPNTSVGREAMESCKDGWVYDHSVFPSTIVTEVCGDQGGVGGCCLELRLERTSLSPAVESGVRGPHPPRPGSDHIHGWGAAGRCCVRQPCGQVSQHRLEVPQPVCSFLFSFFFLKNVLFIYRERGREGEKETSMLERNTDWLPLKRP